MKRDIYTLIGILLMIIGIINILNIIIKNEDSIIYIIISCLTYLIGIIIYNVQSKLKKYE